MTGARANSGRAAKQPTAAPTPGASLPLDASALSIVTNLEGLDLNGLRRQWRAHLGGDRALHIVEDHAEIVRSLFRRYLEAGSVVRLKQQLDAEGVRIPVRIDVGGRPTGGGPFSRGHIYKILSNPIYVGRIAHKGETYAGRHPPIVTLGLRDEVQQSLRDHLGATRTERTRQSSDALLIGKLYDDGGNRMSPTWARRGSKRWRYYVSHAALQGDKSKAGSILRVPAADVESLVAEALGKLSPDRAASPTDIREIIDRVVIGRATIRYA